MLNYFTTIIYCSESVLNFVRKSLDIRNFHFTVLKDVRNAQTKTNNVFSCWNEDFRVEYGKPTPASGKAAFHSLKCAVADLKAGKIDALVTAPISKKNIQREGFDFTGHTEFLQSEFDASESLMFMVCDELKTGIVTAHIPLSQVASSVTKEKILQKLRLINQSLKEDFGVEKPKIAVLGLNPHAGEEGLLGTEEQQVIIPAIQQAKDENIFAYGPFPADGFYGQEMYMQFDAVLAMYHDQGLVPFKALKFTIGVNFTAGLSKIRTSPAHGTGFAIAGKNIADETPFKEAIFRAISIFEKRMEYRQLNENPLQTKREKEKEA
jgi:4-hydroxythreonine-4-phosphate dehydrogenase